MNQTLQELIAERELMWLQEFSMTYKDLIYPEEGEKMERPYIIFPDTGDRVSMPDFTKECEEALKANNETDEN